jgi:hypothetical protein
VDHQNVRNLTTHAVRTRFELAAPRWAEAWLQTGRVSLSVEDMGIVGEFLEGQGWTLEGHRGARIRIRGRSGRPRLMSREAVAVLALRQLAANVQPA